VAYVTDFYVESDYEEEYDGDTGKWSHYAVNRETGERKQLDVSPNYSYVPVESWCLLVALDFPTRADVPGGCIGPLGHSDLIKIKKSLEMENS